MWDWELVWVWELVWDWECGLCESGNGNEVRNEMRLFMTY